MKIRLTKPVIFTDQEGNTSKQYQVGDILHATAKSDERQYFVTAMGGIWYHEAEEIKDE